MNFTYFGGRRFLLCLGASAVCTVLVWFGKIDGNVFRDLILGTTGIYVAGNTTQKWRESKDGVAS